MPVDEGIGEWVGRRYFWGGGSFLGGRKGTAILERLRVTGK